MHTQRTFRANRPSEARTSGALVYDTRGRRPRTERIVSGHWLRLGLVGLFAMVLSASGTTTIAASEDEEACDGMEAEPRGAIERGARKGPAYEVLEDVNLPTRVEDKIKTLADRFHKKTGRNLVITSGTRDAKAQAEVIFTKLEHGDDIVKLYKNKLASLELLRTFQVAEAAHRDRPTTIALLTDAIRGQMKKGVFISAHLRAGAADLRSTDMTPNEKRQFVDSVGEVGGMSVMLEATPAHFHMQLQ